MKKTLHSLSVSFLLVFIFVTGSRVFAAGPQPVINGPAGPVTVRPIPLTISIDAPATAITPASLTYDNAILNTFKRSYAISYDSQFATSGNALYSCLDQNGNIYVADDQNSRIQQFDANHNLVRTIGAPGTGNGQLSSPGGIAIDASGNIYVSDQGNHRIMIYHANGTYWKKFGTQGSADGQFSIPAGLTVDASGKIYVTDQDNSNVQVFDNNGTFLSSFGTPGTGNTQFNTPSDIKIDPSGNIYVADASNNRIQVFKSDWTYLNTIGASSLIYPTGIALDGLGNIAVANNNNSKIQVFTTTGSLLGNFGTAQSGPGDGIFNSPVSIAADGRGHLFVADLLNNRVQELKIKDSYTLSIIPSSAGTVRATLPAGSIKDIDGNASTMAVYTVEYRTATIDVTVSSSFDNSQPTNATSIPFTFNLTKPATTITPLNLTYTNAAVSNLTHKAILSDNATFGGATTTITGPLGIPISVAPDGRGYIYVGDNDGHRILVFSEDGQYVRSFGSVTTPAGISPDANGNLYIVDKYNSSIQVVNGSGAAIRSFGVNGSAPGQLSTPSGVFVEIATSKVYVADQGNNRVQIFDLAGNYISSFGVTGTTAGKLSGPNSVVTDAAGNIYVADAQGRIQKFSSNGVYISQIGSGKFSPHSTVVLATDGTDKIYATDNIAGTVQIFTTDDVLLASTGGLGTEPGLYNSPDGIAIGKDGTLYVADQGNKRMQTYKVTEQYTANLTYVADGVAKIDLTPGTITDANGIGNPDASFSVTFDNTPPAKPTGLTITSLDQQLKLDWAANAPADGVVKYNIYGGTTANSTTLIESVGPSVITKTYTGLTNGTLYYYHITAVDALGNESVASDEVSAYPKANQTITLTTTIPNKIFGDPDFDIAGLGTASSNLAVTYSIVSGPATINGSVIHITGAGTITVGVDQAGNNAFNAAAQKTTAFNVAQATTIVDWDTPNPIVYGTYLNHTDNLNALARNGVPGTYVYNPDETVLLEPGQHTLSVQFTPTSANYTQATQTVTIQVNKITPVITWNAPAPISYNTLLTNLQLNASVNGGILGTLTYNPNFNAQLDAGNAQTLSVKFTPADGDHYNMVTKTVTIDVNKTDPLLNWIAPAPVTYGTALSTIALPTADIPGSFTYNPALNTIPAAGGLTITATFHPLAGSYAANYNEKTIQVHVSVNKADPVITWADPLPPITVNKTLADAQLPGANVPGTFTYNRSLTDHLAVGTYTITATFTPNDTQDYNTVTQTRQLTVNDKLTPVIVWNDPSAITYGARLNYQDQLNAFSTVTGSFSYTPQAGSVLPVGTQELRVDFTPSDVSTYNQAYKIVHIDINKATPVINLPDPLPAITVGTPLQINATANIPGQFTYSPSEGTQLPLGANTITVTFTPDNTQNYTSVIKTTHITVNNKQTPVITWATPADITYGTKLGSAQKTATVAGITGTFAYTFDEINILPAGQYTLHVIFTPANTTLYNQAFAQVVITINKATPTITWNTPQPITSGITINSTQLNASVSPALQGVFTYIPAAGTTLTAGTHPLSVTFVPSAPDDANYTTATKTVILTVNNKITPVINWSNPAPITYGTALSYATQLKATVAGGIPGTFTYNPDAPTVLEPGLQQLNVLFTPTDNAHYNPASKTVNITVNKKTPTVTWANPVAINAGTALGAAQLNATASVPGNFLYTPDAGTVLNSGTNQTLSVTFTPTDNAHYSTVTKTVNINVNKLAPVVTWANPADITPATPLGASQLNATANTQGTFIYTPASGTLLSEGSNQLLSVTFTPDDLSKYTVATKTVRINVARIPSVITWSNPGPINVGTPLGAAQLNATANVPGTFIYTPAAGTILNAGANQTLSVTFTPTDALTYTTVTRNVSINVNKLSPTVTWANPANVTPGTALSNMQLNATADVAGTFIYSPANGTVLGLGDGQVLSVIFNPTDAGNYASVTKTVKINVRKLDPVITWSNPGTIIYGTALSAVQLNATANVAGTFVYTPANGAVLDVGNAQPLSVTFTPADGNTYNTLTKTVTINIRPAVATITWANPAAIPYGTALSSIQLNASADIDGTFTYQPAAGAVLNGGTQRLSVTFTPDDSHFAQITKTVNISVTRVPLTVTADNASRLYKQDNPVFTMTYTGFVNGDTPDVLTQQPVATTTATSGSDVGVYTIVPASAASNNYSFKYVNGTLTVLAASRSLSFDALPVKTYGDADFNASASIGTGETPVYVSSDINVATIVNGNIHITGAGTAIITASVPPSNNYTPTASIQQTLVINKATQFITFNAIPQQQRGDRYDLSVVTASSGLPVTIASNDIMIAAINGQFINNLRIGSTTIVASQPGNANYLAATSVIQPIHITDPFGHEILVRPAVSPNGDGINDVLYIEGIEDHPKNRVTLMNRNGVKIYEMNGYDNATRFFDGRSNITGAMQTPGTYFYLVEYTVNGEGRHFTGYFVLKY